MASPHSHTADALPVCTIHDFQEVFIFGGAHLSVMLRGDRGPVSGVRTFSVDGTACITCGLIELRVPYPERLRALVEATEEHGKGKA